MSASVTIKEVCEAFKDAGASEKFAPCGAESEISDRKLRVGSALYRKQR
jgi:hypothetical protein